MSTKVYYGFRCKRKDFYMVTAYLTTYSQQIAEEKVKAAVTNIMGHDPSLKGYDLWDMQHEHEQKQDGCFFIPGWYQVWLSERYILFNTYALYYPKYESRLVHEYGYWNNVDKLDTCTNRQWQARHDMWTPLLDANPAGQFVLETVRSPDIMRFIRCAYVDLGYEKI